MPKEQLNTPARRVVKVFDSGNGNELAAYHLMRDDEEFPTEENTHIEHTLVVYLGWRRGVSSTTPPESPDSGGVVFTISIAEEEILREAEGIKSRQEKARLDALEDGFVPPKGGWTSRMMEFTSVILSRRELNDLIDVSRRARNAVYGQDK